MLLAPDFWMSRLLASFDFALLVYMDDLLFVSYMDFERTQELIRVLLQIFRAFGLAVNAGKSILEPSLALEFLGFSVHAEGRLALTPARFTKVRAGAGALLAALKSHRRFVSFRALRSFAGLACSCFAAVPYARLYVRALYDVLA